MFNDEFFPTPEAVIEQMLAPFWRTRRVPKRYCYEEEEEVRYLPFERTAVLDPSAGAGAILDYVARQLDRQQGGDRGLADKRLYCFETDPTLVATLQGKRYRMLGYDFLSYAGDMPVSLILMNPPFSAGDKHALHAYQVVSPGGDVVALVNSETLRNPYTRTRQQLARLIEQVGGTVEELGACFRDSERPTDVQVSLIRLRKPDVENPFTFDWHNAGREEEVDTGRGPQREVMGRDLIGNMLTQYKCVRGCFIDLLRAIDGIRHYGARLTPDGDRRDAWRITRDLIDEHLKEKDKDEESYAGVYTRFIEEMRQQLWRVVLDKIDIQKFMTAQVRENFLKYGQQQGFLEFSRENVAQLVGMVLDNSTNILEVAVVNLFDLFTRYHKENVVHVEGWETNHRYKVARKLVLPNWVEFSDSGRFEISWREREHHQDIDKVMCYLTGTRYETAALINQVLEAKFRQLNKVGSGTFENTCQSEFFNIRFFKKGTVHLTFRDPRLCEEFNLRACAGKLWLPDEEMLAFRKRTSGPFRRAAAAPGTAQAEMGDHTAREALLTQLLGSAPTLALPPAGAGPLSQGEALQEVAPAVVEPAAVVGRGGQFQLFAQLTPLARAA